MRKSIFSFVLITVLVLTAFMFVGCELFETKTDEYGFFADEELGSLSDMPKIRSDKPTKMMYGKFCYTATQEEFNNYVHSLYDYLVSKEYSYFGTPTKVLGSFFGIGLECELEIGEQLDDFLARDLYTGDSVKAANSYFFVLGDTLIDDNKHAANGYAQVKGRYLNIYYTTKTVSEDDGFTWNACIELPHGLYDYTFYFPKAVSD